MVSLSMKTIKSYVMKAMLHSKKREYLLLYAVSPHPAMTADMLA